MAKYYFKSCWVCHRPANEADQPNICNRCAKDGWVQSPDPDPERQFGFWKTLWYLITYKQVQRLTKK
jgi:hypothetical protein